MMSDQLRDPGEGAGFEAPKSGVEPGFPIAGGANPRGRQHTNLLDFPKKLHEIKKNLGTKSPKPLADPGGARNTPPPNSFIFMQLLAKKLQKSSLDLIYFIFYAVLGKFLVKQKVFALNAGVVTPAPLSGKSCIHHCQTASLTPVADSGFPRSGDANPRGGASI